jgi:hypothetical protein
MCINTVLHAVRWKFVSVLTSVPVVAGSLVHPVVGCSDLVAGTVPDTEHTSCLTKDV